MISLDQYQVIIIALGSIAFGIYLLVKGGDWTIDNAVIIAERHGISKLFIAATIVAFGTSAPELFTSINANLSGYPGISVGNVIGSNIANVLLVIGVGAIIAPIVFDRKEVRVDTMVMLGATAALVAAMLNGVLPRWGGFLMLVAIVGYVGYQYKAAKLDVDEIDDLDSENMHGPLPMIMLIAGIITLLLGSEVLVQGAVAAGVVFGVPEAIIGMTMIAFGTSVPELTTCIAAARKNQSDMIIGGIIGSNIFNIFSVMAVSAVVKPLLIDTQFIQVDMPVVVAVTVIFALFLLLIGRIGRIVGGAMFIGYLTFIVYQYAI